MWDIVIQVFGTCGLAATIVEFIYVVTNRDSFTNFEEVFFLTAGSFEMLGEVVFLTFGLAIAAKNNFSVEVLKSLIKDPVHNMASAKESAFSYDTIVGVERDIANFSALAFLISLSSVLPWALFFPVWGPSFDGQEGLRLALSVFSLVLLLSFCWMSGLYDCLFSPHGYNYLDIIFPFWLCSMYAMEKAFEVYIILSDVDRLITGDLGWWLVGFQAIEIMSITLVFVRAVYDTLVPVGSREENDPHRGSLPSPINAT